MKIILDSVVDHLDKHVAYISLRQDDDTVIATASLYYEGAGTEGDFKKAAVDKFKNELQKETIRQAVINDVKTTLMQAVSEIDMVKVQADVAAVVTPIVKE